MRHIGELSMENELLRERGSGVGATPPFADAEVAAMSETTSAATGRCYGLQRVCQAWERSHSALYARRTRAQQQRLGAVPARRGPKPRQSDAQLLAAIRADLARSPFQGEGHRKVHAVCGSWTESASPGPECCASCGRTACSPRTAGVRAPR